MTCVGGDTAWCEELYEAQAAPLVLYGRALGLGHAEAEDVLQEVFIALLTLTEPPKTPIRYLVRAFRNRAMNRHRSIWRRVAREFESRRWFEPTPDATASEEAAMRCLTRLPEEQREVIVLKVWNRLTFDEIGELLCISPNTAAGRYRYGLQKLRTWLTNAFEENNRYERSHDGTAGILEAAPPLTGA